MGRALLSWFEPERDERVDSGGNAFNAAVPKPLFAARVPLSGNPYRTNYDVTADGQRFLVNTRTADNTPSPITVTLNWPELLKQAGASK